ncbi:hypothetical protein FACS1894190_17250 [Spirochaetia bacterium]|nr:hypothetical protein FACS1894190_17250 [Spirochaetia bacterium]
MDTMKATRNIPVLNLVFGQNLKKLREGANLSQLALSQKSDITHTFLNDIEHGHKTPSFATVEKLSMALDVSPHLFFINHEAYPQHIDTFLQAVEDFKRHYS